MQAHDVSFEEYLNAAVNGGSRNLTTIQHFIQENDITAINASNKYGGTALMCASNNGHFEIVIALLAVDGIAINATNQEGVTALICAASQGHADVVAALLSKEDIAGNAKDQRGNTALIYAAMEGHAGVVHNLLAKEGISIGTPDRKGDTALAWAAFKGYANIVVALLDKMTLQEIMYVNNKGRSAAQEAERAGYIDIAIFIVSKISALRLEEERVEFIEAAKNGSREGLITIRRHILGDNASVINAYDPEGNTALMWAVLRGHADIVNILLSKMDLQAMQHANRLGQTAVQAAARLGQTHIVALIETRIATLMTELTQKAYLKAAKEGGERGLVIVQSYLQKNNGVAAINVVDEVGYTALMWAAINGHLKMVTALLAHKDIAVNFADKSGDTVLAWAAYKGHALVAAVLLDKMNLLDIVHVNKNNRSAAQEAEQNGHNEIVRLIDNRTSVLLEDLTKAPENNHVPCTSQQQLDAIGFQGLVPMDFVCSIAQDDCVMTDPVTVSSGKTFDRANLKIWGFRSLNTNTHTFLCPLTRKPIHLNELNNETTVCVKNAIERFVKKKKQKTTQEEKSDYGKMPDYYTSFFPSESEQKEQQAFLPFMNADKLSFKSMRSFFFTLSCINMNRKTVLSPQQQLEGIPFRGRVPTDLVCPIVDDNRLMSDPITVSSGVTFDRANLKITSKKTLNSGKKTFACPITGKELHQNELNNDTCTFMKNAIDRFVAKQKSRAQSLEKGGARNAGGIIAFCSTIKLKNIKFFCNSPGCG